MSRPVTCALAAALAMLAFGASAQSSRFPGRAISIVVPFGPGGTTDIMARILADEFGRQLGTTAVVVNTAGAGGAIAMANVARAKPDGYTIAMTTIGPLVIQPARRDNTGYSPSDFDFLCGTYDVPVMTIVAATSPHRSYAELVVLADRRVASFPDVPAAAELGLPVRASVWGGLVAPKGLPADVRARLEAACQATTATATYKERAEKSNSPLVYRSGADFQRFAAEEYDRLKKVVAENGLQEK